MTPSDMTEAYARILNSLDHALRFHGVNKNTKKYRTRRTTIRCCCILVELKYYALQNLVKEIFTLYLRHETKCRSHFDEPNECALPMVAEQLVGAEISASQCNKNRGGHTSYPELGGWTAPYLPSRSTERLVFFEW